MNTTEKNPDIKVEIQQKTVLPSHIERSSISTLIDSDVHINILEMLDNTTNVVYKMLQFLRFQDDVKEAITKYRLSTLSKKDFSEIQGNLKILKNELSFLTQLIESMRIDDFDKYVIEFEKFELDEDIININNNLQNLHTEIIKILQNFGIKEKQELDDRGYDVSKIIVYDIKHVTLLMNYDELPDYIKDFIKEFNEIAEEKGSKAVIFYDNVDKMYRIDLYMGAAAGHRAIIKVYDYTFELIYTDACYSRLLAIKKMCNEYYTTDSEFSLDVKDLQPNLGNVTWKQAVLYFKQKNDILSEMSNLIRVINWDYVVNPNNENMISTVENEVEIIYDGAFTIPIKCHPHIIKIMSDYIRMLRD